MDELERKLIKRHKEGYRIVSIIQMLDLINEIKRERKIIRNERKIIRNGKNYTK